MAGERTLPGLGLTGFWNEGSNGWKPGMDANLLLLSAMVQLTAKSRVTSLPGSPANGDIYIVPSGAGSHANELAVRDNGAWTYFVPAEGWRAWVSDEDAVYAWNGSAWLKTTPTPMYIGTFSDIAPTSNQILLDWLFPEAVTFADEFVGSVASVGVNPTATFAINVQKNGSSVGSISISTAGVATFTTTGTTVSFAAGDVLTLVAPASVDATIARLRITMKGNR